MTRPTIDDIAAAVTRDLVSETPITRGLLPRPLGALGGEPYHDDGFIRDAFAGMRVPLGIELLPVSADTGQLAELMDEMHRRIARGMLITGFGTAEMIFQSPPCQSFSTETMKAGVAARSAREALTELARRLNRLGYRMSWDDDLPDRRTVSKRRYRRLRGRLKAERRAWSRPLPLITTSDP
jgi:hypothetical protein